MVEQGDQQCYLKVAQYPITCQKGLEYWTKMGHLKCLEKSSKTNTSQAQTWQASGGGLYLSSEFRYR